MPAGFHRAKVVRLAPGRRYHSLGAIKIDFTSGLSFESASYALFNSAAKASALAKKERAVNSGGFFHVQVKVIGWLVVAATVKTRTKTMPCSTSPSSTCGGARRHRVGLRRQSVNETP